VEWCASGLATVSVGLMLERDKSLARAHDCPSDDGQSLASPIYNGHRAGGVLGVGVEAERAAVDSRRTPIVTRQSGTECGRSGLTHADGGSNREGA